LSHIRYLSNFAALFFDQRKEVKPHNEFIIPLTGLPLGLKHHEFELSRDFFVEEAYEGVSNGQVTVLLTLDKHENMIELLFQIEGWLEVNCDRCGDAYQQSIRSNQKIIFNFGDHYEEESDDIFVIPADLHEYNLRQLIYEYTILSLPLRKIHPNDKAGNSTCNPNVLNKLNAFRPSQATDPRWDALKKLQHQ
jgi:uncharacterized metal-binding protein YceD (DUF177 family)